MKKIMTIVITLIMIIISFFIKINYKKIKYGNTKNNKSTEEITKYILGINSYEANEEITIKSNKNSNKYIVKEKYNKENNIYKKEIIEPQNLKETIFTYDGTNLKIENNKLNTSKIYENYPYIGEEVTSIAEFINNYKKSKEIIIEEENDNIVINIKMNNGNKYLMYKTLYIEKNTLKPKKMEIKDITQKVIIYILYNEIKINSLQKEEILSFKLQEISSEI